MQRQNRFAIQSVMVAVAMAALNLRGAIAVSKTRPRAFVMKSSRSSDQLRTSNFPTDALRCLFRRDTSANLVVKRALQEPLAETLAQIWSPVIASASFTILVLALSLSRPLELRRGPRGQVDEIPRERPMRWRQVTNRVMIAVALIGLNFAGAAYSPTLGPAELELALQYHKGGIYLIKADGSFEPQHTGQEHLIFTRYRVPSTGQALSPLEVANAESHGISVTTIVLGTDGSILGYGGRPGDVTSTPIVLRRPLRSLLGMWWPLIASTLATMLVAVVLWRRARRDRSEGPEALVCRDSMAGTSGRTIVEWAVIATTLTCLNGAGAVGTWNGLLREQANRVWIADRTGWAADVPDFGEGRTAVVRLRLGTLASGEELFRIVLLRGRPSILEIWSPLIASVSVTLLALLVFFGGAAPFGPRGRSRAANEPAVPRPRSRLARSVAIAAALIALNVAGWIYGPYPQPGDEQPRPVVLEKPSLLPDRQGGLLVRPRRQNPYRRLYKIPAGGGAERPVTVDDYPLPRHQFDARNRVLDTIVYNNDGSVVAYEGKAGLLERLRSSPRVVLPPTRSFLGVWRPVVAAVSLTVCFLSVFWLQARRDRKQRIAAADIGVDCVDAS